MTNVVPHKLSVVEFLKRKLAASENSLEEVAARVGMSDPGVLEEILLGVEKMPVSMVLPLARSLNVDPGHLLRIYLRDCLPEVEQAVHDCEGKMVVTERERSLLAAYRISTDEGDPEVLVFEGRQIVALALR